MSNILGLFIKDKWTYLSVLPLFLSILPSRLTPRYQLLAPLGGHRYTLFELSGSTMILIVVCLPLAIMAYAAILDWNGRNKKVETAGLILISIFSSSVFLSECRDSLNYHLDSTRTAVANAKVVKTLVYRDTERRGDTIYSLYSTVELSNSEHLSFKTHHNINRDRFQPPQTATFTVGQGFFERKYVLNLQTQ